MDIYEVLWGQNYYVNSLIAGPYYHTNNYVDIGTGTILYFGKLYAFQVYAQFNGTYYQCGTGYTYGATETESAPELTSFSFLNDNNVYYYSVFGKSSIYGYELRYSINGGQYEIYDCGSGSSGVGGYLPFAFPYDSVVTLQARGYSPQKYSYTDWGNTRTVTTNSRRPSNFYWTSTKNSGAEFNLSASEWNALANKINAFRTYKNRENYWFTTAYAGSEYEAYYFNQAVAAIGAMIPSTSPPDSVSSGQIIYASQLNGLVSSLNSII